MKLPIKMQILQLDPHTEGCVECWYTVVDAAGETVVPRNHFVCKAKEFDVVAAYTLERLTAKALTTEVKPLVEAAPEARALLAEIRGDQAPPPAPAVPTPLDQTVSPPGIVRAARVK